MTFSNKVVRPLDKVAKPLMPQFAHSLMEHLVSNNYMSDTLRGTENTKKKKKRCEVPAIPGLKIGILTHISGDSFKGLHKSFLVTTVY